MFWLLALAGTLSLKVAQKRFSWPAALAVTILTQAVVYSIATSFTSISTYPFSLGWSETTNYYRASILFANRIYGIKLALPSMHPTLNFMLAIPFFFGNLPVWVHRAWYAFLLVGSTIALGFVFVRRLKLSNRSLFWLLVGWAFLFLMQGPIHIHLQACALIVLWGVVPQKFWRTTLVILVASVWAGMSRLNWYPVPGLFAAVLYLLEVAYETPRSWLRYLWKPVFWFTLGLITALTSQFLYVLCSGNIAQASQSFSALTSDLLWYRLLPSATNPVGILTSVLLVPLPILVIILLALRRKQGAFHVLRLIGIVTALTILFLGGLVVSIKIGGGSDLHNMDAYFILLMLVGGYFYFDRMTPETGTVNAPVSYPPVITVLAILVPVWVAIQLVSPIFTWDRAQANQILVTIRSQAEAVDRNGGEVLFISERHLLALKMLDIRLVPEYEKDYLMEMVMSHNRTYLDRFQAVLRAQRFGLIIAEPQFIHFYGSVRSFGEENDLWVQEISAPLLCYYEPIFENEMFKIALYVPRDQSCK